MVGLLQVYHHDNAIVPFHYMSFHELNAFTCSSCSQAAHAGVDLHKHHLHLWRLDGFVGLVQFIK